MKVIGLSGSPRGENSLTKKLVISALAGASAGGAETGLIDIARQDIDGCKGCYACFRTGRCVIDDDFHPAYHSMLDADGIIIGSPVYFNAVSAQLKAFIDRTADCRHCLLLSGKYGMSVTTTAYSGAPQTIKYMNDYLIDLGAYVIGGIGHVIARGDIAEVSMKKAAEMGRDLADAIRTKRAYAEQDRVHQEFIKGFRYGLIKHKDAWINEYNHYLARGWIQENCPVGHALQ